MDIPEYGEFVFYSKNLRRCSERQVVSGGEVIVPLTVPGYLALFEKTLEY